MISSWLIGRELLRRKAAAARAEDLAAGDGPATAAATDAAAHPDAEAESSAELLQLPVELEADENRGLFRINFGRGGDGDAAGSGDGTAGAAAEGLPEGWAALLEEGEQMVDALGADPEGQLHLEEVREPEAGHAASAGADGSSDDAARPIPQLAIVMLVCGTRGDVQPFIALGRALAAAGHRVRLASHACYRDFVTKFGLEFYPLGGDPEILSEFIVKNRGVVPKATELPLALRSTEQVREVLQSCYSACTAPDPGDSQARAFTAQAIIANPPSYGHIHCAEKLGVPLHMVFTMPWTPTAEFACPLATLNWAGPNSRALNKLSWGVVFDFIWTGMLHMLNSWRQHELGLPPIRTGNSGGIITHVHKVPFMYCWSEAVVPKPADWPAFTDVVGYFFLAEGALAQYAPPPELEAFLAAGPPPVYVGFGSLVLDDPAGLTRKVVEAGTAAGVRLLISKGWGGLGEGLEAAPEGVLLLDKPCPHDWLFQRCAGVVHHGGAGTTAAGIKAGLPTAIVAFFGDQFFWGKAVHSNGLGPQHCPVDQLTTERLAGMLRTLGEPGVRAAAQAAAAQIATEDGVAAAVAAFHHHLPLGKLARGERVEWALSKPQVSNVVYETGAGFINLVRRPIKGAHRDGVKGALKGAGKGLLDLNVRPVKGLALTGQALHRMAKGPGGGAGEEG